MFDGIKVLDLSVSADTLLQNGGLLFPLALDEQTGAILNQPRRASYRGLTFIITPRQIGGYRVEVKGSIHRYYRNGVHNADDFTLADLLAALDQFVMTFGINPFTSRLNNVEFGVNVVLPFSVLIVLNNLISYKHRLFTKEQGDGFAYYQCRTQRYIVKLYDKGKQYGLPDNVLRVEVKVLKMEYLTRQGIQLSYLGDLLTVANYEPLGALLARTFNEILFDEPTIDRSQLTASERNIYQNGCNPRYWSIPDGLTAKECSRKRKALQRAESTFRALINKHRKGEDWVELTAKLINQTWERLSTIDDGLLTQILECLAKWHNSVETAEQFDFTNLDKQELDRETLPANWEVNGSNDASSSVTTVFNTNSSYPKTVTATLRTCPKLTGLSESNVGLKTVQLLAETCLKSIRSENGEMSQINPLSIKLIWDNDSEQQTGSNVGYETVLMVSENGEETDSKRQPIIHLTATQLRDDPELLAEVEKGRKRYAKGSKENEFVRAAHNIRNDESNPRNNLAQQIRKLTTVTEGQSLWLFPQSEFVRLTTNQQISLDYWRGTGREIRL